jgi:hypothetical protein
LGGRHVAGPPQGARRDQRGSREFHDVISPKISRLKIRATVLGNLAAREGPPATFKLGV